MQPASNGWSASLYWQWILYNTVAFVVVLTAVAVLSWIGADVLHLSLASRSWVLAMLVAAAGALLSGGVLGALQWLVIRQRVPVARKRWIVANVGPELLGWLFVIVPAVITAQAICHRGDHRPARQPSTTTGHRTPEAQREHPFDDDHLDDPSVRKAGDAGLDPLSAGVAATGRGKLAALTFVLRPQTAGRCSSGRWNRSSTSLAAVRRRPGTEPSGISPETPGLPEAEQKSSVETFVTEVMPVLRATYPSRVWA